MKKKGLAVAVILLFISVSVISATATPLDGDVEIKICAGFLGFAADNPQLVKGNVGFGICIVINNTYSEPVWVHEKYEYWTLLGKKFHVFKCDWLAPANYIDKTGTFGYPWTPCYFQITVDADNKTVSRSGFSICNFVIMQDRKV